MNPQTWNRYAYVTNKGNAGTDGTDPIFLGHENTKGAVGFASFHWSELYLGGMHVNTYTNGSTYFSHADHLGSERTETDPNGNTNASAETNLPFGEWTSTGMQS